MMIMIIVMAPLFAGAIMIIVISIKSDEKARLCAIMCIVSAEEA